MLDLTENLQLRFLPVPTSLNPVSLFMGTLSWNLGGDLRVRVRENDWLFLFPFLKMLGADVWLLTPFSDSFHIGCTTCRSSLFES